MGGLLVSPARRTTAFGFFSGAALFGGALSPSVAGFLAHWDLRGIYYLDAGLFLALAVLLLAFREPVAAAETEAATGPQDEPSRADAPAADSRGGSE
jgi:MFS family permease